MQCNCAIDTADIRTLFASPAEKVSPFPPSQFITIQVQDGDKAKCRSLSPSPPLSHPYCLIHSHALFHSISPSRSLCSLMFYLISHNKASLWTAINCVWIFPLRRNRELSERAPVPQAAFILMQRSIAIFIAGSITHVTVVLWLGPLHRKKPDNITAEVCKTIQLW